MKPAMAWVWGGVLPLLLAGCAERGEVTARPVIEQLPSHEELEKAASAVDVDGAAQAKGRFIVKGILAIWADNGARERSMRIARDELGGVHERPLVLLDKGGSEFSAHTFILVTESDGGAGRIVVGFSGLPGPRPDDGDRPPEFKGGDVETHPLGPEVIEDVKEATSRPGLAALVGDPRHEGDVWFVTVWNGEDHSTCPAYPLRMDDSAPVVKLTRFVNRTLHEARKRAEPPDPAKRP